ncbi:MAG TPA: glycoside-pentoside-hexuronide (GPH):cation symporter, partial [Polyangiaceae bacterium]|nr:glycoside-pentoside-hexuronide (GPH):cation symporter [Polyangiaceae bacterium]
MSDPQNKLSFVEKAGYSVGDAAANFVFQLLIIFQAGFYTDVMGISAAALGTLLLLVRFADAVFDPVMGAIADRTTHRWGKFRPWVLWSAVPFALVFWAAFTVPGGTGAGARLAYAAVTYTLLMMVYSLNNVPYSALMGVMTGDSSERTGLASYRFVAGIGAAFVVQGFTLPLVGKLGGGDDAKGWSLTVAIYAVVAIGFFLITFFTTKERIQPPKDQEMNLKHDLADLRQNGPWMAMFGMTLFVFITLSLRGGSYYYYFTYYVDAPSLRAFVEKLGLATSADSHGAGFAILDLFGLVMKPGDDPSKIGFSVFNMTGNLVQIMGVLVAKPLADRFGKKAVFTTGLAGATLVQIAFFGLEPTSIGAMFLMQILSASAYGPTIPLLWAMIGDTADYSEWKTGRRATGFVFAGVVFALKAGLGFGGAISGWLLAAYGYTVETAHDPAVLNGIRWMASVYSAVPFGIGVLCMLFYSITKELNLRMTKELTARRLAQP